ncbi:putative transcriptional regulator, TetR family protein [Actinoplanes italicus]|uniref:TetR family transcriptional regulator n=1 Tax=Actinoplanes italicus TaxID=113567 RepID=A0A2T0KFK9_9ACTN|nr:TetR family transcriptional regulator [Actinoplanes italicus]PRX22152.1 TetR family transcriptional regulator [Actinoplanes italicus]GIE29429.1 putative transcriptional regulator, TetR family protein [Actinoplanes italicus]
METAPSYRDTTRARLRDSLVSAARELTVANGWDRVRMVDVARAAGVSRQTVYNEFGGRDGLAEAVVVREIEWFAAAVRSELFAHGGDARAAVHAAVLHTLREAASNTLVRAILTSTGGGADELLPFLTTRSGAVLGLAGEVVAEWAGAHLPGSDPAVVAFAGDSLIRLTVSHIMLPSATLEGTAESLADLFVRLIA